MDELIGLAPKICNNMITTAANVLQHFGEAEEINQRVATLQETVGQICETNAKMKQIKEVVAILPPVTDKQQLDEIFNEKIADMPINMEEHRDLNEFNRQLNQILTMMQSASQTVTKGDDELEIETNTQVNRTCPFSKAVMTEPMRNAICGHIYDKKSVLNMIQLNPRLKCPIVGCGNQEYINMETLQVDIVSRIQIEKDTNGM